MWEIKPVKQVHWKYKEMKVETEFNPEDDVQAGPHPQE